MMKHFRYMCLVGLMVTMFFTDDLRAGNIAVFCALDADVAALKEALGGVSSVYHVGKRKVTLINTGRQMIHVARMRPGAAAAAVDAESVLTGRAWRLVFSVGACGALREDLEPGSWGIVTRSCYWPRIETKEDLKVTSTLPADGPMESVSPAYPQWSSVSSEVFVGDSGLRSEMRSRSRCDVVEMNLEGLLAAIDNHQVQAIHLRVVSDRADELADEDFAAFCKNYRGEGGAMIAKLVKQLPDDPRSIDSYERLSDLVDEE